MAGTPLRAARMPPVAAPEIIEFQGSSFFRKCTSVQSIVLNMPPHTAKLPARIGDRVLTADRLPIWKERKRLKVSPHGWMLASLPVVC